MADRVQLAVRFTDGEVDDCLFLTEADLGETFTTATLNRIKAGTHAKVNTMKAQRVARLKANAVLPSEDVVPDG